MRSLADTLHENILDKVRAAKFFSILTDEVMDCSNLKQLPIVIRFVDGKTGDALASKILSRLETWRLDVMNCRGQGYDRVSNMTSSRAGFQHRICAKAPLAFYTHCQAHQLNLCIVTLV